MEETWQTLQTLTEYSSSDLATANAAWDRYKINGFVALPKAWTADRQWPSARDMPGDTDKGIYVVDGFHQLHCLVSSSLTTAIYPSLMLHRLRYGIPWRIFWRERLRIVLTWYAISTIATMLFGKPSFVEPTIRPFMFRWTPSSLAMDSSAVARTGIHYKNGSFSILLAMTP